MNVAEAEHLLDTYTLEDLLNMNDLTEADALVFLVTSDYLTLPNVKPLDFEDV